MNIIWPQLSLEPHHVDVACGYIVDQMTESQENHWVSLWTHGTT